MTRSRDPLLDDDAETYPVTRDADMTGGLHVVVIGRGAAPVAHALPASGRVTIGRVLASTIAIQDASISRRHAELDLGAPVRLRDVGSANGVRVRGRTLAADEWVELVPGDAVELGTVMLLLCAGPVDAPRSPPSRTDAARSDHTLRPPPPPLPRTRATDDGGAVIEDPAMVAIYALAERVAPSTIPVLILGETGAGKEVVAAYLHARSPRAGQPFVQLDCGVLGEALIESELFGHEKGSFTGATGAKQGLIESAEGGTVFLDEIGEMPLATQVKLLRVLEEHEVRRVGGLRPRKVDVRFVAATHRDLAREVAAGRFRQDLFFRLNGIALRVPPLRERRREVLPLARRFAARASGTATAPTITAGARAALERYAWPGNVRELRNAMDRAVLLAGAGRAIELTHLPLELLTPAVAAPDAPASTVPVADADGQLWTEVGALERRRILDALAKCGGNQSRAAELLGISRRTLVGRLSAYDVPRPRRAPR